MDGIIDNPTPHYCSFFLPFNIKFQLFRHRLWPKSPVDQYGWRTITHGTDESRHPPYLNERGHQSSEKDVNWVSTDPHKIFTRDIRSLIRYSGIWPSHWLPTFFWTSSSMTWDDAEVGPHSIPQEISGQCPMYFNPWNVCTAFTPLPCICLFGFLKMFKISTKAI